MTLLARIMAWLFVGAWGVRLGAWCYACRYWYARTPSEPSERERHRRKLWRGWSVFVGAATVGIAAATIAELAGGWR